MQPLGMMTLRNSLIVVAASAIVFASASWAGDDEADEDNIAKAIDATADKMAEEIEEHTKNRVWFVVPIPASTPTFGTGLVLGGAYFYPQTEEQKKAQPASITGAAGFYTDNDSRAFNSNWYDQPLASRFVEYKMKTKLTSNARKPGIMILATFPKTKKYAPH